MMKTVCVLEGNMRQRKGKLDEIKASLADHELFVFSKDDDYENVYQTISEISCFGERRLFVIKELPDIQVNSKKKGAELKALKRAKVINNFKKIFSEIPLGNLVVFDNIGISSAGFLKEVEKHGRVCKYKQKISKSDAETVISSYFGKRKIDVDEDVQSLIANSLNIMGNDVDIDKFSLLLIQLYHYVYGKSIITKKDVFAICSTSKDFIIWSLYDIFENSDKKDKTKYSRSFKMVMGFLNNSRYFQHEVTMLMRSMLWRYGLLLMGKSGRKLKISKKDIEKEISNIRKLKSSGKAQKIKMSPKDDKPEYSDEMVNNVLYSRKDVLSYYTFDELLSIYSTISKALVKVRSGCSNSELIILLQIIFLTICGELGVETSSDDILEHKKMLREV